MIRLNNVTVSYQVDLHKVSSFKEWILNGLFFRHSARVRRVDALSSVSLHVKKGTRLGIIGANGAGKSSLLKVVSKVVSPSEGDVRLSGRISPMIEIGAGFNLEMTGRENIYLNGAFLGFGKRQLRMLEASIVSFAELDAVIDQPVKTYSSGMVARLAFSIATSVRPDILVIDEILAAGDEQFQRKATARMRELVNSAGALLLVSHNLDLVRDLCNECIWLQGGRIASRGSPEQVITAYLASSH